jgi:hypothetical protein
VKYIAQVSNVCEVSLVGTADFAFWKDYLSREELVPAEKDGKAQVLIVAATARFRGVRFQEISFSVLVAPRPEWGWRDAAHLLRAFNSRALFAWSERTFFSTPYYTADVELAASVPASVRLRRRGEEVFAAVMGAEAVRGPRAGSDEDRWDGPVFLPHGDLRSPARLFFARITGTSARYPFEPSRDSISLAPSRNDESLHALARSGFVPTEWLIRENATHAKSKTFRRDKALVVPGAAG